MCTSEELSKLADLHARGVLTDEEFSRAKSRLLDSAGAPRPTSNAPVVNAVNSLRRSLHDRWIGGVCGGIASITGVASWAWRLIFVLLFLFGGTGGFLYLLLWLLVPLEESSTASPTPAHG
jgi:phage shock protein C